MLFVVIEVGGMRRWQGRDRGLALTYDRFDPSLDEEVRAFSRSWLEKASETAAKRSKDEGVGQYGNYARKSTEVEISEAGGHETDMFNRSGR